MGTIDNTNTQVGRYILDIPKLLWKWKIPILLSSVLCAVVFFFVSKICITPLYKTSATLYVSNGIATENPGNYISSSDLSASSQLVDTYAAIILSDAILEDVIADCSLDIGIDELASMLSINSVNNTEVFTIAVQYHDPQKASEIVNSITKIAPEQISSIINGSSVTIINNARVPSSISYPSYKKVVVIGFALGMFVAMGYLLIKEMMNTRIRTASDFLCWEYPLLASVPDFVSNAQEKYGYYKNRKRRHKKDVNRKTNTDSCLLTDDTPFAVQEAYKTLRTNVIFSSPDQEKKILIVTSAKQGEAKTTTAINLAIAFAQNQSKVLLISCDLRLPTIAKRLKISAIPGLTDLMIGMDTDEGVIRVLDNGLHILPSGTIPPNPTEILGSKKMERVLQLLSKSYDYIIVDTPPLETMPDAAIISKYATDVILVARQNVAERNELGAVINKLELAQAKIMGFVFTCVAGDEQYTYKKYGYHYGYPYSGRRGPSEAYDHAQNNDSAEKRHE